MKILRKNKTFSRLDYSGLSSRAKSMMKELRSGAAKELIKKREKLKGIKDKELRDALRDTYLQGSKYKAEIFRKALQP